VAAAEFHTSTPIAAMVAHARGRSADGAMMIPTMHSYELNKLKIPDAILIYRNFLTRSVVAALQELFRCDLQSTYQKILFNFGVRFHSPHNGMMTSTFCIAAV